MTYLDYVLIGIIVICAVMSYSRGLIKTLFGFGSTVIGMILAYFLYPSVSAILIKHTELYNVIKEKVILNLKLEAIAQNVVTPQDQIAMINQLNVPEFIKKMLISNNNSEIYNLLDVTGIKEYIGGSIATIAINVISFILVIILSGILIKIIAGTLDLVAKLPGINLINRISGLCIGVIWGILVDWVLCALLSFLSNMQASGNLFELINKSIIANYFLEHNIVINYITDIAKVLVK